ncbi:MAG: hypothetical protein E6R03_14030 [Hyphomicrobiaceae bacterium]|nr:MAG: hypothetical protein E6R03_14030 [Hyphomicrobiaceae bacterium]
MSWRLEASGARRVVPTAADDDGISTVVIPTDSSVVFEQIYAAGEFDLTSDAPVTINLGAVSATVNFIVIRVKGGYVKVDLTSTLGVASLFVEPRIELRSDNNPYTVLTLTRPVGVEVTVNVFVGKRS